MSYDGGIDIPKQKTAIRQLIELLEDTKKTKCKTLQEVIFFDGVLALIDTFKYEAVNEQQIIDACNIGNQKPRGLFDGGDYFDETFENYEKTR